MFMTNSSDISLNCDVCGRIVQGVTFMNGMKFCAKCYQETFGKPEVVVSWAKDNPFEKLEQENKTLRRALELACEVHSENDKAYKIKSKQRSAKKYFDYFIQQAKEQCDD